jgi:hypothetical protein
VVKNGARSADGLRPRASLIACSRNCQSASPLGLQPARLVRGTPRPLLLAPHEPMCVLAQQKCERVHGRAQKVCCLIFMLSMQPCILSVTQVVVLRCGPLEEGGLNEEATPSDVLINSPIKIHLIDTTMPGVPGYTQTLLPRSLPPTHTTYTHRERERETPPSLDHTHIQTRDRHKLRTCVCLCVCDV